MLKAADSSQFKPIHNPAALPSPLTLVFGLVGLSAWILALAQLAGTAPITISSYMWSGETVQRGLPSTPALVLMGLAAFGVAVLIQTFPLFRLNLPATTSTVAETHLEK